MSSLITFFRLLKLFLAALKNAGATKIEFVLSGLAHNQQSTSAKELKKVAQYAGIPVEKLMQKTRKREIVEARQIAMYLAKRNTKETLSEIGFNIGRKDHTTVIHACKTVENLIETDHGFREKWLPLLVKP